ncbi:MAG: glycosyltransferase family 39 protein, partial [Candidatus Omnitrophica bacterium]|nr:glycosyltransferase family 39 protein [Candidatus Omnitrophota bacterium]
NECGPRAFPALFRIYISDQANWVLPSPLRIAFISLSALWLRIFGMTYFSLSSLSLFSYLLMLGVSYYFAKKYFGERYALFFVVLIGFSPLNMAMARRALLDSTANLFLVSSMWLFFDMLEDRKKFKHVFFTAIYAIAILMKESAVLLIPVFISYLFIRKYGLKKDVMRNDFLSASIYPAAITAAIYLIASGSVSNVLKIARIIISSPATNQYAVLYCSGSWIRYITDFFLISPLVLLFALGFIISYLSSKKRDVKIAYFLIVTVVYYLILNLFAKNIRYAMLLDIPLRLFALGAVLRLTENRGGKYRHLYAPIIILALAAYDYMSFYRLFIADGIYDPVSALLLSARGIALPR